MTIERWKITDRDEWLKRRRPNINGSEVGALFGCNPYVSHYALYADRAGLVTCSPPDSDVLRRGRILEASVQAALTEYRPDLECVKADEYVWSPDWRLGCTPDFYVLSEKKPGLGVMQAKTVAKPIFDEDWASGPPRWIILQTLQEMMLTECAWGMIAALVLTSFSVNLQWWEFTRHEASEAKIKGTAEKFWADVEAKRSPPPNWSVDGETIKAMYPLSDGPALDLTGDNRMPVLLEQLEQQAAIQKHTETQLKAIKAEIAAKLGASASATLPGWEVTYKLQHRKETVQAASSFRVMRAKRTAAAAKEEQAA